MHSPLKHLFTGVGMTAGALALAWIINAVFQRSWSAIALILLAMLIGMLLQRMVAGGIPVDAAPATRRDETTSETSPTIRQETAGLPGVARRFGWMALPPALAFLGVMIAALV